MKQKLNLVLRIGNFSIKGAFFLEDLIIDTFHLKYDSEFNEHFDKILKIKEIEFVQIGSNNESKKETVLKILKSFNFKYFDIDYDNLSINLDVEKPKEVGMTRVANAYGALVSHPLRDCIVIDMETTLTIDVITKERVFLGGIISPSMSLSAKALYDNTDTLPLVELKKPKSCLSRSLKENIQSGLYYGLIGAIEKITKEIKNLRFSHSRITTIATGEVAGCINELEDAKETLIANLEIDLKEEAIDYFEPDLTFLGLNEILKEKIFAKVKT